MAVERGGAVIERMDNPEHPTLEYDDPKAFIDDLESWQGFQEIHDRYISQRKGSQRELEANFLESNDYKEAVASFVEAGNEFHYDPGRFFRAVPQSQTGLVRDFEHGLNQYFRTSVDVLRWAKAGVHEEAYKKGIEKMNLHDELASLLQQMGLAPGKSAAKQLVRLIAVDKGYDTEESLRMGDIQRRQARVEASRVVYGE